MDYGSLGFQLVHAWGLLSLSWLCLHAPRSHGASHLKSAMVVPHTNPYITPLDGVWTIGVSGCQVMVEKNAAAGLETTVVIRSGFRVWGLRFRVVNGQNHSKC